MAATGRPSKIHSVVRYDGETETTAGDLVIQETRNGQPLNVAAALAGIAENTVLNWIRAGARVEERLLINETTPLDADDLAYRDFLRRFERARADYESEVWDLLGELAKGGTLKRVTRKTIQVPVLDAEGKPTGRTEGKVVEETATVETARPSFPAVRYILDNKLGRQKPLEVRLSEGALSDDERASELAKMLREFADEDAAMADLAAEFGDER